MFLVVVKNNLLCDFNARFEEKDKDDLLSLFL
jgi:hypothetical protein